MRANLFVTGCYRSGTTLLEKLLHHHEDICLASQPFPVLFFYLKGIFLQELGIERRYPLDHLFLEADYRQNQFDRFLAHHVLTAADMAHVFDRLADYTEGLWTKEILSHRGAVAPGPFIAVLRRLNDLLTQILSKETARYRGGKEILCEEYIPFLIANGVKVVLVIRDPRDMVTSLNFKEKYNLTGDNRPVLYSVRVWRKSVAYALAHGDNENFTWVTYEDLVSDPMSCLDRIAAFLGLGPFSEALFQDGLQDQYGNPWQGNSSFKEKRGISKDSKGRFKAVLPEAVIRFIEATCLPELKALGYPLEGSGAFDPDAVSAYRDPFEVTHAKFPPDYSSDKAHAAEEIERYGRLTGSLSTAETERWFLFEAAYRSLREAASG